MTRDCLNRRSVIHSSKASQRTFPLALLLLGVGHFGFWSPAISHAQQVPPVVDPGRIRPDLRQPAEKAPVVIPEPSIPDFEETRPKDADAVRFVLESIELSGNPTIPAERLAPAWSDRIGNEVSLGEIYDIAARVTAAYRAEGYILSRAIVPEQAVEGGTVRIEVIEGYIAEVVIEGDESLRPMLLKRRADSIRNSRPLEADVLERYLLLINDLPGMSARAVLRPSPTTTGASELLLRVDSRKFQAFGEVNSEGSRFNGPLRAEAGTILNNILGLYDQTQIRGISTFDEELQVVAADHTLAIGHEGTTLTLLGSYVDTEPDGPSVSALSVEGDSWSAALVARHPFLRSRRQNLDAFVSLEALRSESRIGNDPTSRDELRVVRVGTSYDIVDRSRGVSQVGITVSQGIDVLGATKPNSVVASRRRGRPDFTKLEATLSRLQGLGRGFNFLTRVAGQYAFTRVLAPEETGFGGSRIGRAYDASELTADHGLAAVGELQWGTTVGRIGFESVQLFAFGEYGAFWSRQDDRPRGPFDDALDLGFGFRANFFSWLSGQLSVAQPLIRPPLTAQSDGDYIPRSYFELVARY